MSSFRGRVNRRRARSAVVLAALSASACLPPPGPPPGRSLPPTEVRVTERGGEGVASGRLVRLTEDSVHWSPSAPADAAVRSRRISDLDRLEVGEVLDQRDALKRGLLRGALVGTALGGTLYAVGSTTAGGAAFVALATAWVAGVIGGQSVDSPRPPRRWRVVFERRE